MKEIYPVVLFLWAEEIIDYCYLKNTLQILVKSIYYYIRRKYINNIDGKRGYKFSISERIIKGWK
ncbi:hypothetical protein [Halocella sp. SP3-1]|uniref:hypothetical protein n=1 Tax=Halocella sp. SP3-1 TaxID=2382161 RepID=UPI000F7D8D59|nr:hypothetical protein [Halocella sp. SP3-1]